MESFIRHKWVKNVIRLLTQIVDNVNWVEDIRHFATRCPAYHAIRTVSSGQLKKIIIDNSDTYMWKTHFSDWESFMRIIICPDITLVMVPELFSVISSVEDVSKDYLYKLHTKRLF